MLRVEKQKWTTYANFVNFYNRAVDLMFDCTLFVKLDESMWHDTNSIICYKLAYYVYLLMKLGTID